MRQVDGEEEQSGWKHPETKDWQEPEEPANREQDRQRKADRKPARPTQARKRAAQRRDQTFQRVELPMKPALAP